MVVVHGFIKKNPMICILCLYQTSLIEYDSSNTIGKSRKNSKCGNSCESIFVHSTRITLKIGQDSLFGVKEYVFC